MASSYAVHSIIRKESQIPELEALGSKPVVQSIEESSVDDLAATIKKHSPNVVIWSAGAGGGSPERTKAVDHEGTSISCRRPIEFKRHAMANAKNRRHQGL